MIIQCIKQVVDQEDGCTVYFKEGAQYKANGDNGRSLHAIDEEGDEHCVSEDRECNCNWEKDDWFNEHFRIMNDGIYVFSDGLYGSEWFNNMLDFLQWCDKEIDRCRPTGFAPQSMYHTTGQAGFDAKYPSFEDAYKEYQKHVEKVMK